jgi:O-antigen/teichoic acid export membrane protein
VHESQDDWAAPNEGLTPSAGGKIVTSEGPASTGNYRSVAGAVARGSAWSLGGQAAAFASALIATPFTIRLLGPARYGLWSLLQSGLTWVGLADFGMASASTRYGGDCAARGDAAGEARAIWTAAVVTLSTTILAAAGAAVAAGVIVKDFFHLRGELETSGSLALRILCVVAVLQAINGAFNTPQVVRLRWRSITLVTQGSAILQIVALPVALAVTNGGLITVAAVVSATAALGTVGTIWVAARLQPGVLRPQFDPKLVRTLFAYGGALTLSGLATIPLTTAERLLLGHFASTSAVAYYAVASRLGALVSVVPAAVAIPLFPALIALRSSGTVEETNRLFGTSLRMSFMFLTPVAMFLACIAQPFLSAWAGETYGRHSTDLFYIVLLGVYANSLTLNAISYLAAIDRPGILARIHLLEVIPYVAGAAALSAAFGAVGAAIAWSGRALIDALLLNGAARRVGGAPISPLSTRRWASAVLPLLLGGTCFVIARITSSLWVRLGCTLMLAVLYGCLMWYLVLTGTEQSMLMKVGSEVAPRLFKRRRS